MHALRDITFLSVWIVYSPFHVDIQRYSSPPFYPDVGSLRIRPASSASSLNSVQPSSSHVDGTLLFSFTSVHCTAFATTINFITLNGKRAINLVLWDSTSESLIARKKSRTEYRSEYLQIDGVIDEREIENIPFHGWIHFIKKWNSRFTRILSWKKCWIYIQFNNNFNWNDIVTYRKCKISMTALIAKFIMSQEIIVK